MKWILLILIGIPISVSAQTIPALVAEISAEIKGKSLKLAVLEFPYANDKMSDGPEIIRERVTTALAKQKVGRLIERNRLDGILEELKLQRSGVVDETTIKQIGKVLGVDVVILGTLNDLDKTKTEVNARLIDAETGEVLGAGEAIVPKTWEDVRPSLSLGQFLKGDDKERKNLVAIKTRMDAGLAELKAGIGTTIVPQEDGTILIDDKFFVTPDEFDEAATKALVFKAVTAPLKE